VGSKEYVGLAVACKALNCFIACFRSLEAPIIPTPLDKAPRAAIPAISGKAIVSIFLYKFTLFFQNTCIKKKRYYLCQSKIELTKRVICSITISKHYRKIIKSFNLKGSPDFVAATQTRGFLCLKIDLI
jgi:hypothetical protein